MTLNEIEKVLKNPKSKLYAPVLLRLAGNILPRLNEISGENGGPLIIHLPKEATEKYAINALSS